MPRPWLLFFNLKSRPARSLPKFPGAGLAWRLFARKAEKLGGHVSVETRPGLGTTFRILLPLTLAAFRGILVQAAKQIFVIPATSVVRVARVKLSDIKSVENRDTISLDGRACIAGVARRFGLNCPRRNENSSRNRIRPNDRAGLGWGADRLRGGTGVAR